MAIIIQDRLAKLMNIPLGWGKHHTPEDGMCAIEAAAWIAGEPFSDNPRTCVGAQLIAFMINWNDSLPSNKERDRLLKPLIPLLVGTAAGNSVELKRALMCADWLIRVFAPAWFDLCAPSYAATLRLLPEIVSEETLRTADSNTDNITLAVTQSKSLPGGYVKYMPPSSYDARYTAHCHVCPAAGKAAIDAVWQSNVPTKYANQIWQPNMATKRANQIWQPNMATKYAIWCRLGKYATHL